MMYNTPWKPSEEKYLLENYETDIHVDELKANLPGRTVAAIYSKATHLGLKKPDFIEYPKLENADEIDWNIHYYKTNTLLSDQEIADKLGLSKNQVKRRVTYNALHLRPPQGTPPDWFTEIVKDEGVLV